MGEIADMCARALDDFLIGFDQSIGFPREWSNLFRKFPRQALGAAGTDCSQSVCDAFERCQPETDLKGRGEQKHCRKYGKCNNERLVE